MFSKISVFIDGSDFSKIAFYQASVLAKQKCVLIITHFCTDFVWNASIDMVFSPERDLLVMDLRGNRITDCLNSGSVSLHAVKNVGINAPVIKNQNFSHLYTNVY